MSTIICALPGARPRIDGIEGLRALAACLVVAGHVLDDAPQFGVHALAGLAGLPIWQGGVDLFFVISGFIMVWTFGSRFGQPGAAREFLFRRIARIVPLYWLATLATAGLLAAAPSLFDRAVLEWRHLLLSMLFVPHHAPGGGTSPILGVGWTLNYEMLFYVLFALGLALPTRLGVFAIVAAMAGLFMAASLVEPTGFALGAFLANSVMLEFLLGIGIGLLVRRCGFIRALLLAVAALLLAAMLLAPAPLDAARVIRGGLPAGAVVCLVVGFCPPLASWPGRALMALGAASYALYLGHTLVINLTKGAALPLAESLALPPAAGFALYAVAACALAVATAAFVHRRIERPIMGRVRTRILGPIIDRPEPESGGGEPDHAAPSPSSPFVQDAARTSVLLKVSGR